MAGHTILRTLGTDPATGRTIVIKDGMHGPYVTDGDTNVTLGELVEVGLVSTGSGLRAETSRVDVVSTIGLSEAIDLLNEKRERAQRQIQRTLGTDPATGRTVLIKQRPREDPYISDGQTNALPRSTDAATITLTQASEVLQMRRDWNSLCGNCGEYGHTRRTCPDLKPERDRQATQTCTKCGKTGHPNRNCPTGVDLSDIDALIDAAAEDGSITYKTSSGWSGGALSTRASRSTRGRNARPTSSGNRTTLPRPNS